MANLFVIAAPSGTGKTSLIKEMVSSHPNIKLAISYTTRKKRKNEEEGKDYFFVDRKKFLLMKDTGLFLENAEVFGNLYGTEKKWVNNNILQGIDIILELDYQGALQIKKIYEAAILIFIIPPSLNQLGVRLRERALDSKVTIEKRLLEAKKEITYSNEFDFMLVNNEFDDCLQNLENLIIKKENPKKEQTSISEETRKFIMEEEGIIE
tara:strand:+ start:470 stop:1096 length:627 start_codon:yes stop_codon:yes gene_type:complete